MGLLPNWRSFRCHDKLGRLAMTEGAFICHCEATEGGRGNLKRTDLSLATGPLCLFSGEVVMKTTNLVLIISLTMLPMANVPAGAMEFELLMHTDNVQLLPQPQGDLGVSGDHLLQTADDITGSTFNPDGCFSFNFMNPVGISPPDYPPGYVEGIHSMSGTLVLDIDLLNGGALSIDSLTFNGYVASGKPTSHQRLVQVGDTATSYNTDGMPNGGTYIASADANWAFQVSFDWYYDTPFAGPGTIDMTFDNYQWSGFIIPVNELTIDGMNATTLDDPLGYFGGTSVDFESWLLSEVTPRLPEEATYLLFIQGEAHPGWTNPQIGMTTDGIVGETIIGCAVPQCGDPNHPYPVGDLNQDCRVDLLDLAILTLHWLECTTLKCGV
jgi:hypothetical protein